MKGGSYAGPELGGRHPYLHPVTGEPLPELGKLSRVWGSQRAYLRHLIASLPEKVRAGGEDAVLRQIIDEKMRAEFGDDYERRAMEFAKEAKAISPSPSRRTKGKGKK